MYSVRAVPSAIPTEGTSSSLILRLHCGLHWEAMRRQTFVGHLARHLQLS